MINIQTRNPAKAVALLALLLTAIAPLQAQNNSWISTNGGFWEETVNWSAGLPGPTESIYITNGGDLGNIFIGFSTTSGYPDTMTVSNLTLSAPDGSINFLNFSGAGTDVPLHILNELDIEPNGDVYMDNSSLQVDGLANVNGLLWIDSGSALVSTLTVVHQFQLNGGVLQISPGILTADVDLPPSIGSSHVGIGGGTLIHTNGIMQLGGNGAGLFGQTGGTVFSLGVQLSGPESIMSIGGGDYVGVGESIFYASQYVSIGDGSGGYSSVTVETNGTLIVTNAAHNAYVSIGSNSVLTLDGGVLQMDNLILTNGGIFTNISGTLIYTNAFQVENGSSVIINGGSITTPTNFTLGSLPASTGTLFLDNNGTLTVTSGTLGIGNDGTLTNGSGSGNVTVSAATLSASIINLGSSAGGLGSLTVQSNSVVNVNSNFTLVSSSLTSTSTVTLSGGSLIMSNGVMQVGPAGSGQLLLSGGSHTLRQLWLGSSNNLGSGFFHMSGGSLKLLGTGSGPGQGLISNFVLWDGGDLDGSGTSITIGDGHDSTGTLTGSAVGQYAAMYVGYSPGFTGTYLQSGGTMTISSAVIVGALASTPASTPGNTPGVADCSSGAVGVVNLSGGTLYVTNATHTAIFDVINGTVVLSAGATLVVDNLIITNACGHFIKAGGTLTLYNPALLDPNLDADGDGVSNGAEAAAGTDPLDPTSLFQITNLEITNTSDLSLVWTTEGGHNYVVQTNGDLSSSSFNDLSGVIAAGGSGAGTTNFVHRAAAKNPAGFYRVRLAP